VDGITYPEGFVENLWFTGEIIDTKKENISSKSDLIDFTTWGTNKNNSYTMRLKIPPAGSNVPMRYLVFINPLCENKLILSTTEYKLGMPIEVYTNSSISSDSKNYSSDNLALREHRGYGVSAQNVILVKGNPEYWADSAFVYNNKSYTILPVCGDLDGENSKLDFTYTIKRI
jgi:hypothetical protein